VILKLYISPWPCSVTVNNCTYLSVFCCYKHYKYNSNGQTNLDHLVCAHTKHLKINASITFTSNSGLSTLIYDTSFRIQNDLFEIRAELRQSFSTCARLLHVFAFSKVISLVGSNQCNYFENATACSKRTLKTTVETQLYDQKYRYQNPNYYKNFCR